VTVPAVERPYRPAFPFRRKTQMPSIGSLYAHGYSQDRMEFIQSLGFSLRPESSVFAGSQVLRFLDFSRPPALEFIRVEDENAYREFLPPGMTPYSPGISIVIDPNSKPALPDYADALREWKPYQIHFDNEGGSDPAKPGTDYLNFAIPLLEKTFIYLSQSQDAGREHPVPPLHANTALRVTGLVFDLPEKSLMPLSSLFKMDPAEVNAAWGGVNIFDERYVTAELRRRKKLFPLAAVIVETGTLTPHSGRGTRLIRWRGKPSALVETNPMSWDIILTT
jgi:hypothetical protein